MSKVSILQYTKLYTVFPCYLYSYLKYLWHKLLRRSHRAMFITNKWGYNAPADILYMASGAVCYCKGSNYSSVHFYKYYFRRTQCVAYGRSLVQTRLCLISARASDASHIEDPMPTVLRMWATSRTAILASIGCPLWMTCMECSRWGLKDSHICGCATMERSITIKWFVFYSFVT